jgi:hypothetical protein
VFKVPDQAGMVVISGGIIAGAISIPVITAIAQIKGIVFPETINKAQVAIIFLPVFFQTAMIILIIGVTNFTIDIEGGRKSIGIAGRGIMAVKIIGTFIQPPGKNIIEVNQVLLVKTKSQVTGHCMFLTVFLLRIIILQDAETITSLNEAVSTRGRKENKGEKISKTKV